MIKYPDIAVVWEAVIVMRCVVCGSCDDKVLESRMVRGGAAIRRRRMCLCCGHRFTTYEEIMKDSLMVKKRDGRLEEFSRQKILSGIVRACQKRPISMDTIERMVDGVIETVESTYDIEVPSVDIGELIMVRLHELDQIAYIRFASVYKRFDSAEQFVKEVKSISSVDGDAALFLSGGDSDVRGGAE